MFLKKGKIVCGREKNHHFKKEKVKCVV